MMWSAGTGVDAVLSVTEMALQNGSVPAAWRRGLEGLAFSSSRRGVSMSRSRCFRDGFLEVGGDAHEDEPAQAVVHLGVDVLVAGAGRAGIGPGERRILVQHVVDADPERVVVLDLERRQQVEIAARTEPGVGRRNGAG